MKTALMLFVLAGVAVSGSAALTLCPNSSPIVLAQHGIAPVRFLMVLQSPTPFDVEPATVALVGSLVVIDQMLLPGATTPCSGGSALSAELPIALEPGAYSFQWTVKRMIVCGTGFCEAERATFGGAFVVAEPLGCQSTLTPLFDTLPYPAIGGSTVKLLFSLSIFPLPTDPVVTMTGMEIRIEQTAINTSPVPYPGPAPCSSRVIDLGVLPAGRYNVLWQIRTNYNGPLRNEIYSYSFDVLDPASVPTVQPTVVVLLILSLALAGALVLRS